LESHQIEVNLVSSSRTDKGIDVPRWLDSGEYKTGRKETEAEMQAIRIKHNLFQGDWN